MKQIPLTQGRVAIVDDEDYDDLIKYKWHASECAGSNWYAKRNMRQDNRQVRISMHRQIIGLSDPKIFCDHRDNNGLNNQKSNLRIATRVQNAANRKVDKRSKSGFKCVSWSKKHKKWVAYISSNKKQRHLGYFNCPIEAARAYDTAAIELHGEFANLNFP